MNRETDSQESATAGNLFVVHGNGRILACTVSQVYGGALLRAMALRLNRSPYREIHVSFLLQYESLTPNEIRKTAQAVAPGDNIMFIDDGRKILSCQINSEHGVALIEKLQQPVEEDSQALASLSHATIARASEVDNDVDMLLESPRHASPELDQPHATSSSSFQPGIIGIPANNLGILSDQILSSANRQPYDRDWMTKYNINEDCLEGPPSMHKVDVLLRYGAIKVGDKLCITYRSDGGTVVKFGEVLECPKKNSVDIRIAPAREDFDGILHDCKSPKDIVRGMEKEFQMRQPLHSSEAWKVVNVVSENGLEIGSLWKVRQAYQVFTDEMEEWGSRNRQNSP